MTFLAKLGAVLAKGIGVITGILPLVSPFFGAGSKVVSEVTEYTNDLSKVGAIVVQAEALLGGGGGADKLNRAAPLVANVVKTSEMLSGHKIKDEALFIQGCTNLTSAVAQILNALDPSTVQTSGNALPAIPAPQNVAPAAPAPVTEAPAPAASSAPAAPSLVGH